MRILHVIGRLDFSDGGPPMIATRLAAAQARLGHQVAIACYASSGDEQADQQLSRVSCWEKVKVHRFPQPGRAERLLGLSAARLIRPLVDQADALHLHNVWEPILLAAARAARSMGKPYVQLANGMLDPWSMEQKKWKKRVAMALAYRRMLNGSILHVGTEEEGASALKLGLTSPIAVLPNGVTLEDMDPLPPHGRFIASKPILQGRRYILFLGRLHYKKGLDYLADAFAILADKHPNLDLVVAGPDDGEHMPLQQRVVVAGLASRVHIVGPLYGPDKLAALVDSDCFVLPSRQEGFSVAILEAMAACVPVVISEACHFPEVAEAGAGEVVKLQPMEIAAALDRVLNSPQRRRYGWAGRALVEAHFTWQRVAERSIAVYERALSTAQPVT